MIRRVTPPNKRSPRERPPGKELLSFWRRAFLLDQRHPADRTFAGFVRVDLRMHAAGVIEVLRTCLLRLFFHFIGGFLHLIRSSLHLIGESFLFWLSNRPVLHPFVAFYLPGVFLLFSALHLHALVLHPLHAGRVLHVVFHFFCAFGVRLRRAQLLLYRERRFITDEEIARS